MPWFQFTDDFNWHVPERNGIVTIAYKDGMKLLVREACAAEAEKAGKGHRYKKTDGDPEVEDPEEIVTVPAAGEHHFAQVDAEPWVEDDDAGRG